jgi:DNA-binding beta-propeller fold protein YncE
VPRSIARDAFTGAVYVADYGNHRVMKFLAGVGTVAAGGNGAGSNSNQLNNPSGAVLDANATVLYISNAGSHNIKRWIIGSSTGTVVAGDTAGSSGSTSLLLNAPLGLAIDM